VLGKEQFSIKISKHPDVTHKATSPVWVCNQAAGEKPQAQTRGKGPKLGAVTT